MKHILKLRQIVILGLIILGIVGLIAAISAGGSRNPSGVYGKTYTVTVKADIGIAYIKITNQNTVGSCTILPTNLPFSFNCTQGDMITLNATASLGYTFNSWFRSDGTFYNQNPYSFKVSTPITVTAGFIPEA